MDGYSIQEAAEVLGVPKRRVRELVARGVILGSQEDDGALRVYLQPRPPASIEPAAEGELGFEASPFRELLTEFRNLTERYGQALLALGESRGEVASLRGRVEALETRMDLRLGSTSAPSVVEWHAPPPAFEAETLADLAGGQLDAAIGAADEVAAADAGAPAPESEPNELTEAESAMGGEAEMEEASAEVETAEVVPLEESPAGADDEAPAAEVEAQLSDEARPSRPRRAGFAAGGIAEALARAMDPSTGELPVAIDVAAYSPDEASDEPEPAGAELVAEEEEPPIDASRYSTEVEEPDWLAEGEYTWLDAADRPAPASEAMGEPTATADAQPLVEQGAAVADEAELAESGDFPAPEETEVEEREAEPLADEVATQPENQPETLPDEVATRPEDDSLAQPVAHGAALGPDEEGASETEVRDTEAADVEEQAAANSGPIGPAWDQDWDFGASSDAVSAVIDGEAGADDAEEVDDAGGVETVVAETDAAEAVPRPDVETSEHVAGVEPAPADAPEIDAAAAGSPSPDETDEVALMWLGSEFDDREEYAAEFEVESAGWQGAPAPRDELTRIARDQGWDSTEVEAIRNLLEPVAPASDADRDIGEEASSEGHRENGEQADALRAEDAPWTEAGAGAPESGTVASVDGSPDDNVPAPSAERPDWPEADHSVTFTLPGGDELHRALQALGLPTPSREATPEEPATQPQSHQWSKIDEPPASETPRAIVDRLPRPRTLPAQRTSVSPAAADAGEPPIVGEGGHPHDAGPTDETWRDGEPEWLRGRRDPAARAYRRLRRIFPG